MPILADGRGLGVLSDEGDMIVVSFNHPSTVCFKSLDQILCLPFTETRIYRTVAKKVKGQNYLILTLYTRTVHVSKRSIPLKIILIRIMNWFLITCLNCIIYANFPLDFELVLLCRY